MNPVGGHTEGRAHGAAHDKVAAMQAAEARASRQRRATLIGVAAATVIALVVGAMVVLSQRGNDDAPSTPAKSNYVSALTSVPASALDAVGAGTSAGQSGLFQPVAGGTIQSKNGKPRILYIGAEFCPYCGMERWPMTIALSRFGTFAGLHAATSASDEPQPIRDVPTVSYHGASYTSDYLSFDAFETTDRDHQPLDALPAADEALMRKLNPTGGIPWVSWGDATSAVTFDGMFLPSAKGDEIAAKLKDPSSSEAKAILGAANVLTARMCTMTHDEPAGVCTSAGVKAAAAVAR